MSCYFCDINGYKDFDGRKVLRLDWGYHTALDMYYNPNNNKFSIAASGEGRTETELNYCPKCGRRLTESKTF